MVVKSNKLSVRKQCELLGIHRGGLYYKPVGESQENLAIMELIDRHHLEYPTEGVLSVQDALRELGHVVNHKRVRRLMRKMGIQVSYPKKNLSKLGLRKYIRPYLLRNLDVVRPNQVWEIDITYIPMSKGFMYLVAIIDVYSRYVVGWAVSNSLEASVSLSVLKEAIGEHGKPEIVNSDQGSQFTCHAWIEYLEREGIKISMDGKGRALDNVYIERLWRSVKYNHVYLYPADDGLELHAGLRKWFDRYNTKTHQGIGRRKPCELYSKRAA